jgi:hypothetical protein
MTSSNANLPRTIAGLPAAPAAAAGDAGGPPYRTLVSVAQLQAMLAGGAGRCVLLDCSFDLTDAGKGAAVFVGAQEDAERVFGENFVNTMDVAARNVRVEVTLPPGFAVTKFSGEEISENPNEVEPQHIGPNDTIILHNQIETCAPDLVSGDTEVTVKLRYEDSE